VFEGNEADVGSVAVKGGWCAMVSRSNGNSIELRVVPFREALALCSGMETGNLRNGH
jgi:hypothetical protein